MCHSPHGRPSEQVLNVGIASLFGSRHPCPKRIPPQQDLQRGRVSSKGQPLISPTSVCSPQRAPRPPAKAVGAPASQAAHKPCGGGIMLHVAAPSRLLLHYPLRYGAPDGGGGQLKAPACVSPNMSPLRPTPRGVSSSPAIHSSTVGPLLASAPKIPLALRAPPLLFHRQLP